MNILILKFKETKKRKARKELASRITRKNLLDTSQSASRTKSKMIGRIQQKHGNRLGSNQREIDAFISAHVHQILDLLLLGGKKLRNQGPDSRRANKPCNGSKGSQRNFAFFSLKKLKESRDASVKHDFGGNGGLLMEETFGFVPEKEMERRRARYQ